jgi:hypothetical protein
MAATKEEAENRLHSMGIPGAILEDGLSNPIQEKDISKNSMGEVVAGPSDPPKEPFPSRMSNPVMVLDQISRSAQKMNEDRSSKIDLDFEIDSEKRKVKAKPQRKTRERILFGEPEKTISVADKFLSEQHGEVLHFSTAIDPKGKFFVAIVIRHEVEEDEKQD